MFLLPFPFLKQETRLSNFSSHVKFGHQHSSKMLLPPSLPAVVGIDLSLSLAPLVGRHEDLEDMRTATRLIGGKEVRMFLSLFCSKKFLKP
jgi:hypothetical protein